MRQEELLLNDVRTPMLRSLIRKEHVKMIEEEIAAVELFLRQHPGRNKIGLAHQTPEQFVWRSYALHRDLIQSWGGWSADGASTAFSDKTHEALRKELAHDIFNEFYRQYTRFRDLSSTEQQASNLAFEQTCHYKQGEVVCMRRWYLGDGILQQKTLPPIHPDVARESKRPSFERSEYYIVIPRQRKTSAPLKIKVRAGQRIAPVVLRALEEAGCLVRDDLRALWSRLFERLGSEIWSNTTFPLETTFTCRPLAFLLLGSYGEKTCYTPTKERDTARYFLAADVPNSFVLKVKRFSNKEGAMARAWGVAEYGRFAAITNFYLLTSERLLGPLTPVVGELFGLGEHPYVRNELAFSAMAAGAYVNSDTQVFFPKKSHESTEAVRHIMKARFKHCADYGLYGNYGAGPMGVDAKGVPYPHCLDEESFPYGEHPTWLWPYFDAYLERLTREQLLATYGRATAPDPVPPKASRLRPHPVTAQTTAHININDLYANLQFGTAGVHPTNAAWVQNPDGPPAGGAQIENQY